MGLTKFRVVKFVLIHTCIAAYWRRIRLIFGCSFKNISFTRKVNPVLSTRSRSATSLAAFLNFLLIVFGQVPFLKFNQEEFGVLIILSYFSQVLLLSGRGIPLVPFRQLNSSIYKAYIRMLHQKD